MTIGRRRFNAGLRVRGDCEEAMWIVGSIPRGAACMCEWMWGGL